MRFKFLFPSVFVLVTLCAAGAYAQTNGATAQSAEPFRNAIGAYQKNDFKTARASLQSALKASAENPILLYDLGLTEEKDGHLGLAMALWRKALAVQPGFTPADHALNWTRPKLEHSDISHEVEFWESLRSTMLVTTPLNRYLGSSAVLLLLGGWLFFRYMGQRRQARLDEKSMPPFPTVALIFTVLFLITASLSAAKAYDETVVRGTIVVKKIEARSSPDPSATALFDLYEGLEVIFQKESGEWVQVSYPGGSTGWIPRTSLFATTDKVAP
jgi:tetratricopeptide (TPR) repeat protein